jgi:hypothetical protein
MDYSHIVLGEQYTCRFGADRFRGSGRVLKKVGGLTLMKVEQPLRAQHFSVGLPDNVHVGSGMWVSPEMIEPTPGGAAAYFKPEQRNN